MKKQTTQQLKKIQTELCDELIQDTDKIDKILNQYKQTINGFHQYSMGNIILAGFQHYTKTGETIELLSSYNNWQKHNRQVKYGEKGLKILVPRHYIVKDEITGEEIERKLYFAQGTVFDLSQTTGERLELDYTTNNSNLTFTEILQRLPNIKVEPSNKELTRGSTDGKTIWISNHISDSEKICVLFHELAHYKLHFGKDRKEFDRPTKELEAETVSYIVSKYCGIENKESSAYITNWYEDNPSEKIKGLGERLINTSNSIIQQLNLPQGVEV